MDTATQQQLLRGERLRQERQRLGMSQVLFAAHAGCGVNAVRIAETGGFISDAMAERFARVLGISSEALKAKESALNSDKRGAK